jgi:hypothetical protein
MSDGRNLEVMMGTRDTRTLKEYVVEGCLQLDKDGFISALLDWQEKRGEPTWVRLSDGIPVGKEKQCETPENRETFVRGLDNEALVEFYETCILYNSEED